MYKFKLLLNDEKLMNIAPFRDRLATEASKAAVEAKRQLEQPSKADEQLKMVGEEA